VKARDMPLTLSGAVWLDNCIPNIKKHNVIDIIISAINGGARFVLI
jgi:hypothetical protein